jgi:hypothetical protein
VPESIVSELHAVYHEGTQAEEPSAMLDRSIQDAARAELQGRGATKSRRRTPWWKVWVTATSAIAVVVVGLSVTGRVMDEQERSLREEMSAVETTRMAPGKVAQGQRSTEAIPSNAASAPVATNSHPVESKIAKDSPVAAQELAAQAAPAPAVAAATAPIAAGETLKKSQRAEMDQLQERREAVSGVTSGSGPARLLGKVEAQRLDTSVSSAPAADSVSQPAVDAATPEAWLKHIRELRAAGRSGEAAQSLARFRVRYPDVVLPDDLRN